MEKRFFWKACTCDRHGRFIDLVTGNVLGGECCCQNWAINMIGVIYERGGITEEELIDHIAEIRNSSLFMAAPVGMVELLELDGNLEKMLERFPLPELMRGRTPRGITSWEEVAADVHDFLEKFFPLPRPTIQ